MDIKKILTEYEVEHFGEIIDWLLFHLQGFNEYVNKQNKDVLNKEKVQQNVRWTIQKRKGNAWTRIKLPAWGSW